jgi:competence protein ComEC
MEDSTLTKKQKREIIRRLLIPILLIIAAIFYRPIQNFLNLSDTASTITTSTTDGTSLTVSYLDVGQGDATLISKGNFHMLIDAGKNEMGATVVKFLKKENIEKLDLLIGTHPDSDHIGGLDDVLDAVSVDTVYMPKAKKSTKTYSDVESALERAGEKASMPEIGTEYTYDSNVILRFLSPSKTYSDSNDNSLVVQLAYGKTRFLFMGDAEETAESDILKKGYDLTCDVLKLGHHGSYTATSLAFLQAADPTYAVISCGKNNSYGHPHAEVLARLEDEDVQVYRTDTMGTIQAVSDGKNVKMLT